MDRRTHCRSRPPGVKWRMASPKQVARQILDSLPEDCSLAEIQYRLYVRQMLEEGRQDVRRGDVFSQDEIERDLERWLAT